MCKRGEHLRNYEGPRGRINKDDLLGFSGSDMVEFSYPSIADMVYGKIVEFTRKDGTMYADISVKAFVDVDGEWTKYHDYYDFKRVPVSELTHAPRGVYPERIKRKVAL